MTMRLMYQVVGSLTTPDTVQIALTALTVQMPTLLAGRLSPLGGLRLPQVGMVHLCAGFGGGVRVG